MNDRQPSYDLDRFVSAQDQDDSHRGAVAELSAGRKTGHWMWFVFPQLAGLGHSPTARHFALASLAEATAYVLHPVLGPRLHQASHAAQHAPAPDVVALLGPVDALKLRSSMTVFAAAQPQQPVFAEVLARWFDGERDPRTEALLPGG